MRIAQGVLYPMLNIIMHRTIEVRWMSAVKGNLERIG
jgi:hypothetical protein